VRSLIESKLAAVPCDFVAVGSRVRIRSGPLSNVEGTLVGLRNGASVLIGIEAIQQYLSVEVDVKDIEVLAALDRNGLQGHSSLPLPLKGMVELVYDLNNHASYRVIEPLMYQSECYSTEGQSIALSITSGDDRSFILSTPRLPSTGLLQVPLPFKSRVVDEMF